MYWKKTHSKRQKCVVVYTQETKVCCGVNARDKCVVVYEQETELCCGVQARNKSVLWCTSKRQKCVVVYRQKRQKCVVQQTVLPRTTNRLSYERTCYRKKVDV